jgi:hypothetical protein
MSPTDQYPQPERDRSCLVRNCENGSATVASR